MKYFWTAVFLLFNNEIISLIALCFIGLFFLGDLVKERESKA